MVVGNTDTELIPQYFRKYRGIGSVSVLPTHHYCIGLTLQQVQPSAVSVPSATKTLSRQVGDEEVQT